MNLQDLYSLLAPAIGVMVLAAFSAIVAWAYWPSHRKRFEADGHIPLRDDE